MYFWLLPYIETLQFLICAQLLVSMSGEYTVAHIAIYETCDAINFQVSLKKIPDISGS